MLTVGSTSSLIAVSSMRPVLTGKHICQIGLLIMTNMCSFRLDEVLDAVVRWSDAMQRDHNRLLNRVRQLEREGSDRSVRGVSSGQRARRSGGSPRGPRPRPVFRGSGTEEAPYILVEIEDEAVAGPSRRSRRKLPKLKH